MSFVKNLTLHYFRNYAQCRIDALDAGFVVLVGENGAGKTNCMEAVSLLAPGRGLRNAKPQELRQNVALMDEGQMAGAAVSSSAAPSSVLSVSASPAGGVSDNAGAGDGGEYDAPRSGYAPSGAHVSTPPRRAVNSLWAVRADIGAYGGDDVYSIGTGENPAGRGRIAKLNGEKVSALAHLSEVFACVWFTPAMSGLFLGGASDRRRFFDRLVFAYDPSHAGRLRRYEKALSERSRILKDAQNAGRRPDATWLDGVEITLAETSVALAASRLELLEKLQSYCRDVAGGIFPPLSIDLIGGPEEALRAASALTVEDRLKEAFRDSRMADSYTGGSGAFGAHRSDMAVTFLDKNMPADQCSTGEQKALLLTIILAHSCFIHHRQGIAPVLLLDEITAHLDEGRRQAMFDILTGLHSQVWMSGTEKSLFDGAQNARFLMARDNGLQPL